MKTKKCDVPFNGIVLYEEGSEGGEGAREEAREGARERGKELASERK
jgi:hypothetical protein